MQREAEHAGDQRDEPVARRPPASDRGLGRGELARRELAALRGPRGGHHHQRPGHQQDRHAGAAGVPGRLRLGLLQEPVVHPLLGEDRCVL